MNQVNRPEKGSWMPKVHRIGITAKGIDYQTDSL